MKSKKGKALLLSIIVFAFILIPAISAFTVTYNFSSTYEGINMWAYHARNITGTTPPPNILIPASVSFTDVTTTSQLDFIDGNTIGTTATASYLYHMNLFNSSLNINRNDITYINWSNWVKSGSTRTVSGYIWNYTSSSWYKCIDYFPSSTTVISKSCFIEGNASDFIDSNNVTTFLIWGNSSVSQYLTTDYVSLSITYDDIIINKPTDNQEVLNTLSMLINTSQAGYNQTIWYSLDNGISNKTLCMNSLECQTNANFTHQGFFNVTIWANKTTGEKTYKTISNVFVGNQTTYDFLNDSDKFAYDSGGGNVDFVEDNPTGQPHFLACNGSVTNPCATYDKTNNSGLNISDNIYLSTDSNLLITGGIFQGYDIKINYSSSTLKRITWLWEGKESTSGTGEKIRFYVRDVANNLWVNKNNQTKPATDTSISFDIDSSISNYLNSSNYTFLLITGSPDLSYDDVDIDTDYIYANITYYTPNNPPDTPTLLKPIDGSSLSTNNSVMFNFTLNDVNLDNMTIWLYMDANNPPTTLVNTSNLNSGNHIWNFTNDTGGWFDKTTFYWKIIVNDGINALNITSSINSFQISISSPSFLNFYPEIGTWYNNGTNIYFNFTATDPDGLSTCELWANWTGTWKINYTWLNPVSNQMNYTIVNLTEGGLHNWAIWCNDSLANGGFSINRTIGIDLTKPSVNITSISTTTNSQSVTIYYTYSDALSGINSTSCKYSIFNSSGGIDGINNNQTTPCSSSTLVTTSLPAGNTFNITFYIKDLAGNENSSTKSFTTTQTPAVVVVQGGGGGETLYQSILASNFSLLTTSFGSKMDVVLAKNSVKPRTKQFVVLSKEKEAFTADLYCDATNLDENQTRENTPNVNICDYVVIEKSQIVVSPNEDTPTTGTILIYVPEDAKIGDKYFFNLLLVRSSTDNSTSVYSKLSVSTRVTWWSVFLYKWNFFPFSSGEDRPAYPVFGVALGLFIVILVGTIIIFSLPKKKYPVTGFLLGLFLATSTFILFSIYS